MKKSTTFLLILLAIFFTSTLYLLYLNFNKTPTTNTLIPQTGIVPTKNSTPTAVSTNNWKTYTNNFGGFSLLYPPNLEVNEKNISTKEKQIDFNSQLGNKFSIAVVTSDVSPGWGGGCGPDDMGKVNLLGELKSTCINNENLWAFYFSNTNNSKEFSLSSTFGKDLTKENVLKILSTLKFTESSSVIPKSISSLFSDINKNFKLNLIATVENQFNSPAGMVDIKSWKLDFVNTTVGKSLTTFLETKLQSNNEGGGIGGGGIDGYENSLIKCFHIYGYKSGDPTNWTDPYNYLSCAEK